MLSNILFDIFLDTKKIVLYYVHAENTFHKKSYLNFLLFLKHAWTKRLIKKKTKAAF